MPGRPGSPLYAAIHDGVQGLYQAMLDLAKQGPIPPEHGHAVAELLIRTHRAMGEGNVGELRAVGVALRAMIDCTRRQITPPEEF